MSVRRSIIRSVAAALALTFAVAPAVASADDKAPSAEKAKKGKHGKHGKHERNFPMKADEFKQHVEKKITHARERLGEALDRHKVPDAVKTQIKKEFEAGAILVRASAAKVAADGEVTKDEAKQVRDLAKDLKKKAREKYLPGQHANGQRPARAS